MSDCIGSGSDFREMDRFISTSLETHLFFARIMKEHSFFLMAGFQPINVSHVRRADWFRMQFENLLWDVVEISDGLISNEVLDSGEIRTEFTLEAEKITSRLTGIPIEIQITLTEEKLRAGCFAGNRELMLRRIRALNERALELVKGLIAFKEELINEVKECKVFTANYPLLIEHILREARLYCRMIEQLLDKGCISETTLLETESFWNQIMMEHALFIRGLLDPTEEELIMAADGFARDYHALLCEARKKDCEAMDSLRKRTIEETEKYRDFKAAGTKGLVCCEISSIILPLLADHVLREANHYLRILK